MDKKIVNFYIDGFNIYHRINDYYKKTDKCYKWLNYRELLETFLNSNEFLGKIYFFTAISKIYGEDSVYRHNKYIDALKSVNIEIVEGYWRLKTKNYVLREDFCKCYVGIKVPIEKQTDVKLTSYMLRDAYENKFDKCYLISGDNDFAPALRIIRDNCIKIVGLITPPFEPNIIEPGKINDLRKSCSTDEATGSKLVINLKFDNLINHSFKKELIAIDGVTKIEMPRGYNTF